jgi:hypothetical protein
MIYSNKNAVEYYEKFNKLPHPKIKCSLCSAMTTCFGDNLRSRIKLAGGLLELLDSFKCRRCRTGASPMKPVKAARVTKATNKIKDCDIPKMRPFVPLNMYLRDLPDLASSISTTSCLAPQLYLNNGRNCRGCTFHSMCNNPLRKQVA